MASVHSADRCCYDSRPAFSVLYMYAYMYMNICIYISFACVLAFTYMSAFCGIIFQLNSLHICYFITTVEVGRDGDVNQFDGGVENKFDWHWLKSKDVE